MSSKCIIKFDNNPDGIYESGELLSGAVELITVKLKVIRAIHVTVTGYAKVRWKQQSAQIRRRQKTPETVTYCSNQQYLTHRSYVIGEDGGESFELPPGAYLYRFQIQLPDDLPSSFEGQYGHIRYEVTLRIDRPSKFDNIFKHPFTVITPLNLNNNAIYKLSDEQCTEKTFWCGLCGLCGMRTLTAKVNIPIRGFAPGQDIPFILGINNNVSINCYNIILTLEKNVCYTSHYPVIENRYDNVKILEKNLGPIPKTHQKEIRDFITIPVIPPTLLEACKVIQITYRLHFEIQVSGCHRNVELSIPIIIGTIPILDDSIAVIQTHPTAPKLSLDEDNGKRFKWPFDLVPPPSYEEAVRTGNRFVDEEEDRHSLHRTYMPKYPVYYNCKTPSP